MRYARPSFLVPAVAAAVVVAVPASAQAAPVGESLYVQQAGAGALGAKRLVLRDVPRRTVRFDDRPRRTGGTMPLRRFVRQWRSSFRGAPPNAALVVHGAPAGRDIALLELRRPRYAPKRRTLTFAVRRLRQTGSSQLKGFGRRSDGSRVKRFGSASLFIDPSSAEPVPTIVSVRMPASAQVELSFSNTSLSYDTDGVILTNLNTPAFRQSQDFWVTSTGSARLGARSMSFNTSPGGGNGLSIFVLAAIDPPSSGTTLTGTATVPSGANVVLEFPGGSGQRIANGPFAIPYPTD
ncbi:MAG TPA: hypothetical protein VHF88_04515 [Thermoleophilaceae bacterium]|nr:hypothetical protein [Thermoleophilaceae bacterium]